ncbi:MAG TPA: glutathionylspermidine synthase family protein [Planctomycetia bacterium]|nr:glutathionylspermidine synthase family protein [Planctomycetia bacterium]
MERIESEARPDWRVKVESQGFHFHSAGSEAYWDESAYYRFNARQIDELERATYKLNEMCLEAIEHVLANNRFAEFKIPPHFINYIRKSWDRDELTVYGRFDFVYDGVRPPVLLEYNADTPTALLEASVIQWHWMKDFASSRGEGLVDQFNSIHDRLIEAWKKAQELWKAPPGSLVHFAGVGIEESVEDFITLQYLRDTAIQAGWNTEAVGMGELGWDAVRKCFVDPAGRQIHGCFKLYPWEWMTREAFGRFLPETGMRWLEPPWKMLLSNKALLAILWEMFPDSPYLLPCGWEPLSDAYVRKPILSREGANVAIVHRGAVMLETGGEYGGEPMVYQEFRPLPCFDGNYALVGSWMVNGYAAGIGIREDKTLITGNTSRFVPHLYVR